MNTDTQHIIVAIVVCICIATVVKRLVATLRNKGGNPCGSCRNCECKLRKSRDKAEKCENKCNKR